MASRWANGLITNEMDVVPCNGRLDRYPWCTQSFSLDVGDDLFNLGGVSDVGLVQDPAQRTTDGQRPRRLKGLDSALLNCGFDRCRCEQHRHGVALGLRDCSGSGGRIQLGLSIREDRISCAVPHLEESSTDVIREVARCRLGAPGDPEQR